MVFKQHLYFSSLEGCIFAVGLPALEKTTLSENPTCPKKVAQNASQSDANFGALQNSCPGNYQERSLIISRVFHFW